MKTLLLIIDMQNDFCKQTGALFVNGAEEDVLRLGKFISSYETGIDHIILTQDYHNVIDISHPVFWVDGNGRHPEPFTVIDSESIVNDIWKPVFEAEKAVEYVSSLERQGEFPHVIWPEHCIMGSQGASIVNEIMEPVKTWARKGNYFDVIIKGTNPLTEHFGALMANIPVEGCPETGLNTDLADKLVAYDRILVAGEAKSHCVATTVRQMLRIKDLGKKLIILEDCMSNVTGFDSIALPIYQAAEKEGSRFISSTSWAHDRLNNQNELFL